MCYYYSQMDSTSAKYDKFRLHSVNGFFVSGGKRKKKINSCQSTNDFIDILIF